MMILTVSGEIIISQIQIAPYCSGTNLFTKHFMFDFACDLFYHIMNATLPLYFELFYLNATEIVKRLLFYLQSTIKSFKRFYTW